MRLHKANRQVASLRNGIAGLDSDRVYISEHLPQSSNTILPPLLGSDHNTILFSLEKVYPIPKRAGRRKVWLYNRADFGHANSILQCLPLGSFPASEINSLWSMWSDFFMTAISDSISSKLISLSNKNLPYISNDLVHLVHKEQCLFSQAKLINSDRAWSKYNKVRNQVTSALRSAKRKFFKQLSTNIKSPRDFWSAYHKLSPKKSRIPVNLSHQSTRASTPTTKADLLNHFFTTCFMPKTDLHNPEPPIDETRPSLSNITCSIQVRKYQSYSHPKRQTRHRVQTVSPAKCFAALPTASHHQSLLFSTCHWNKLLCLMSGKLQMCLQSPNLETHL